MTKKGYKTAIIREDMYELAKRRAEEDELSVSDIIEKAIESYVKSKYDLEEKVKMVIKVLEMAEKGKA